jgi:hypothetical protein
VESVLRLGRISTSLKSSLTSVSMRIGTPCPGWRASKNAVPHVGAALRNYRAMR